MKLFKAKDGRLISFGFDMLERVPDSTIVCWTDPATGSWEPKPSNEAGSKRYLGMVIAPEFVVETNDGIIAYQPGAAIIMQYIGAPLVFGFQIMRPD